MITDLQSVEAPLERIEAKKYRLHCVTVGDQPVGLLSDSNSRLYVIFANGYTKSLRNFIVRCDFANSSFGSRSLGGLLEVGYCRILNSAQFVRDLFNDSAACSKLRVELGKLLGGDGKGGDG